ncbi:Condensin-2 complex subunit H2 [Saguinus oedipus]|uniref:Condensin-2 complex subunit H2 n=1 Tax=Saguinus oedipus TaxID=9490 RepID=A0ABQ9WJW2_SAGOE|nr:Condensin-2 complex subunit H2 [Saguinus oedipus]
MIPSVIQGLSVPGATPGCHCTCLGLGGAAVHSQLPQRLLVLCAQETPDPWQSLDPFDSLDSKPFKKGNWVEDTSTQASLVGHGSGLCSLIPRWLKGSPCLPPGRPYSVPPCVEEAPGQKRKRKGAAKLQDFHQWCLAACEWLGQGLWKRIPNAVGSSWPSCADHVLSQMLTTLTAGGPGERARPLQDEGALRRPLSADMEVLYWTHVKEQLETLRKLQRREASPNCSAVIYDPVVALMGDDSVAERWLPRAEEELWPAEEDHLEDSLEDLGAAADDFLEPEECVEPKGADPKEAADLDAVPVSLSYEELVRRNVELFIASSQKFVQETELSQRIRDWEDTVQPLLQEQEQHVPFDIHTYGDQVVSRFPQLNVWCPFAEMVAGQPAFEVCRSMLASLQLVSSRDSWEGETVSGPADTPPLQANDYTVEITQQPGLETAVDTMSLRLLTHQRAHKPFQTYAAPSMAQP